MKPTIRIVFRTFIVALCLAGNGVSPAVAQTAVTSCGQTVADDGVLAADLDCSAAPLGVALSEGAGLDLNGRRLQGLVQCTADCRIDGPGQIEGKIEAETLDLSNATVQDGQGIQATTVTIAGSQILRNSGGVVCRNCSVDSSEISDNGLGIQCIQRTYTVGGGHREAGKLEMTNSIVRNNGAYGVRCARAAVIDGSEISGHVTGIEVWGSSYQPKPSGSYFGKAFVSNSTISGNSDYGVFAWGRAELLNCNVLANGRGVGGVRHGARIESSSVLDSASYGAEGKRVTLIDSVVSGSGTGNPSASDLYSTMRPRVDEGSSCGTSDGPNGDWNVCSMD